MTKKLRLLTGDRPTGALHIGHYAGSIVSRLEMQNSGEYDPFIFIADMQALTDNAFDPEKVKNSVDELMLDYLACGLDPEKCTLFVQSGVPELAEIFMYYLNLVTVARLKRNPTVKTEMAQKNMTGESVPAGFLTYPVSQAADVTAFDADVVPVGEDQLPVLEQTNEIVRTFNRIYGDTIREPKAVLSQNKNARRVPGTDGNAKMGKSLGNCIYLKDDAETVRKKVMSMYTDPNHIRVEDPGNTENNVVFKYLEIFGRDQKKVAEMKAHYEKGGLGDVACKKYLFEELEAILAPIRARRAEFAKDMSKVHKIFEEGTARARKVAAATLERIRHAVGVDYFNK